MNSEINIQVSKTNSVIMYLFLKSIADFRVLLSGILILFSNCQSNNQLENSSPYYRETHRPQIHFSPESQWMNDPNGMVFYEGEYHLFYQYHPESTVWGPMHWGHAVSTDLVKWEHFPIALYPDSLGTIFSGSAVIDWNNTSGFGKKGEPPMIAIFTQHDAEAAASGAIDFQTQSMAYSNDKGRTWTMYEGNPVIPNPGIIDFRDPKVIWHEESQQWVMILAVKDRVHIYNSSDLKDWTLRSEFGSDIGTHAGVWECPDLFSLEVEESGENYWVMLVSINPGSSNGGSGTQYFIGDFDGSTFTLDESFAKRLGTFEAVVPAGEIFEDFEQDQFGDWSVEGNAFGERPVSGSVEGQQEVSGKTGQFIVNSFHGGDASTGTLTSPEFAINSEFINFQLAGGRHPGTIGMNLVVDGEIVRSSTGTNSEMLNWYSWDVSGFKGKDAMIKIMDQHEGSWGYVLVDQIVFSSQKAIPMKEKAIWLDYGRDNYAGVTWSDVPESDGRRIFIGWMSNWDYAQSVPTQEWRSAMTLPRSLSLVNTTEGLILTSRPVNELEKLRVANSSTQGIQYLNLEVDTLDEGFRVVDSLDFMPGPFEVVFEFEMLETLGASAQVGLQLSNNVGETYTLVYDTQHNEYISDRTNAGKTGFSDIFASETHEAPRLSEDPLIRMHAYVDLASIELFADHGRTVLTEVFFPTEEFIHIDVICEDARIRIDRLEIFPLNDIW